MSSITHTLAVIVSRVTVPIFADPARLSQQDKQTRINHKEMLWMAPRHERFEFAEDKLSVFAEESGVGDAVKLRKDHAWHRNSAK